MRKIILLLLAAELSAVALFPQEKIDPAVIGRIKNEAFQNSKAMDHAFWLTDVFGPRMTGSPGFRAACEWAIRRFKEYGLEDARKEKLPWGRDWSCTRFAAHLLEPQYAPLIAVPMPWSPGTNGPAVGEAILAPIRNFYDRARLSESDFDKFFEDNRGKVKGKMVLIQQPWEISPQMTPSIKRFSAEELAELAVPPVASGQKPAAKTFNPYMSILKVIQFLRDEGALALIWRSGRSYGTVVLFTPPAYRESNVTLPLPVICLAPEHYNRLARLLEKKIPARLEVELQARIREDTPDAFNVIAEIPGGRKKDEVVMLGAHLDSWTAGTGAADNAAGCAVVMEAMRILKALDLKMDRTVRIALWGGEEGPGLGSKTYIRDHFADIETMTLKPEHAKLSCYFNLDNGAGKIRGIYLENNAKVKPIFEAWLAPFKDLGATTVAIAGEPYGTDNRSFDQAGLPGFQFIQDPLDYDIVYHSNMDVYDRLQAEDLKQAALIMASFVYHAAMRGELLPRKPLPKR